MIITKKHMKIKSYVLPGYLKISVLFEIYS